jgi:hypothetical protein
MTVFWGSADVADVGEVPQAAMFEYTGIGVRKKPEAAGSSVPWTRFRRCCWNAGRDLAQAPVSPDQVGCRGLPCCRKSTFLMRNTTFWRGRCQHRT